MCKHVHYPYALTTQPFLLLKIIPLIQPTASNIDKTIKREAGSLGIYVIY